MRKIIASIYVTLDGVMEAPFWTTPFWNDEMVKYANDQLFTSDALLLGRVTYEGFVDDLLLGAAWPPMTHEEGFANRMNSLPKYVVSTTLKKLYWNANLIQDNIEEEVFKLKEQTGQDILIYGSSELVNFLMQRELIDEYRIWVHPIIFGSGKKLFKESSETFPLKLIDTKIFSSGVVILTYRHD